MTDKKQTEELNEDELDEVTGGVSLGNFKPRLTEAQGIRAIKKAGIRATKGAGIRVGGQAGIRAIKGVVKTGGGNDI